MQNIDLQWFKENMKDPIMKKYIMGGAVFVFAVVYLLVFIAPGVNKLFVSSRELSDVREKVEVAEGIVKRIPAMMKKEEEIKVELARHSKHLPAHKEITVLLESFAKIADKSGVTLLSITPSELEPLSDQKKDDKYFYKMPIKITAKSGYHELGNFISILERESRVIIIDEVSIKENEKTPRLHNITMRLKTYVSV